MAAAMTTMSVMHVICPQPAGREGGADFHVLDLVEQQVRNGIQVTVLALMNDAYNHRIADRGARLAVVPAFWHPSFVPALTHEIRSQAIDVVHSHGYSADLAAIAAVGIASQLDRASAHTPRGLVLTTHGFIRSTRSTRLRTAINERCLRFSDAIIATSRSEATRLAQRFPGKAVHYIPNGISAAPIAGFPQLGRRPRHLAFIGRLSPEKRPDLFLQVAAELTRIYPDLRVSVIGAGSLSEQLRSMAERLGIADRCTFTGMVDDVEKRLRDIDVMISLSDTEGTPRAVLEAMAAGVAVVATAVGGVPDLITDGRTGVLVPAGPTTVAATVAAIRSLLSDPDRLRAIGEAARQSFGSEFLIENMAEHTYSVYDSALLARRHRQKRAS